MNKGLRRSAIGAIGFRPRPVHGGRLARGREPIPASPWPKADRRRTSKADRRSPTSTYALAVPRSAGQPLRDIGWPFLATRVALVAIGLVALSFSRAVSGGPAFRHAPIERPAVLEMWNRWDAYWYLSIAKSGYAGQLGEDFRDVRASYLPAFPALIALVTQLVRDHLLAALFISNVSLLIFLTVLWHLARDDVGEASARRTVWLYLIYPTTIFLSGAYAESLALAATAGAVLATRREQHGLAAFASALATLARPTGLLVCVLVISELLRTRDAASDRSRSRRAFLLAGALLVPFLALAGYLFFAGRAFGEPLELLSAQAFSRKASGGVFDAWRTYWISPVAWHVYGRSAIDLASAVIASAALPLVYRRLGTGALLYTALVFAIPLATGPTSFPRLMLMAYPWFIAVAASVGHRTTRLVAAVLLAAGAALCMARFATWQWVA
jgi:Mannosyltransferase (PIG-V)